MEISELYEKYKELEERIAQLEFREEFLRYENSINGIILDYNLTRDEYNKVMDIMDEMRNQIDNH